MGKETGLTAASNFVKSTRFQFQERSFYRSHMIPSLNHVKTINFWADGPYQYFGRIDQQRDFIYLPWSFNDTDFISVLENREGDQLKAINFVADAFADLRQEFTIKLAQGYGTNSLSDSIITSIEPARAWDPVISSYRYYMDDIYDEFFGDFLNENPSMDKMILDFESFMTVFTYFLNNSSLKLPITMTGYIQSGMTSILSSGLAIDIMDFEYGDDIFKQEFVKDANFNLYAQLANKYGFLIDINAPYRLVANPNSSKMLEYMSKYGITFKDFFETYYLKAHEDDILILRDYLLEMYNTYVEASPTFIDEDPRPYRKSCSKYGKVSTMAPSNIYSEFLEYRRTPLDYEKFQERFTGYYWLDFFYRVRNIENYNVITGKNLESRIKSSEAIFKKNGWDACMKYINDSFKKHIFQDQSMPTSQQFSNKDVDFADLVSTSY